jgi:DNA-directed RNA polymerase specialized sigma24 family protein
MTVVTKRVAIDYLRAHPDYVDLRRRPGSEAPGAWVDVQSLPSEWRLPGVRPPVTAQGTAGELLAYARRELPDRQRQALELWTQGESSSEIAKRLGVPAAEAERLIRAAVERLRRKFRTAGGQTP